MPITSVSSPTNQPMDDIATPDGAGRSDAAANTIDTSTLDGRNGFRVEGLAVGDELGRFVRGLGDLNDDGVDDLGIGAPFVLGGLGLPPEFGSAYVLYGDVGIGADPEGGVLDLNGLDGGNGFTVTGGSPGDETGAAIEAGDLDGDGRLDLIVSAPDTEGSFGARGPGQVYVLFNEGDLGQDGRIDLSRLDTVDRLVVRGRDPAGSDSGDRLGETLAVGDFNADGVDDLVMGAGFATPDGLLRQGAAYVLFGSPDLDEAADREASQGFVVPGLRSGDGVTDVASGDVNGDGVDDLLIAAASADNAGGTDAGAVYVVFGDESLSSLVTFSPADLDGDNGFVVRGGAAGQFLGRSLASGDVNGDGADDVAFSFGELTVALDQAEAFVLFGGEEVGTSGEITVRLDGGPSSSEGIRITGPADNAFASVGVGDVTGEGVADVLLNAQAGGTAYVVYGDGELKEARTIDATSLSPQDGLMLTNTSEGSLFFPDTIDAAGDLNDDGIGDIAVGAAPFQVPLADPGQASVVFGAPAPEAVERIVVTTGLDVADDTDGELSLREAVEIANERAGEDTITFADGLDRIDATGPLVVITDDLVIDGGPDDVGPAAITLGTSDSERDFIDDPVLQVMDAALKLEDMTVRGEGLEAFGGGLELNRVNVFAGYYSFDAIEARGSTVVINDSSVSGSGADGGDGGGGLVAYGDVTIARSEFSAVAGYSATPLVVYGNLTLTDSLIDRSSSVGFNTGLRVGALPEGGRLEMVNSTVTGVQAGYYGGAAIVIGSRGTVEATITNSTVAANGFLFDQTREDAQGSFGVFALGENDTLRLENNLVLANFGEEGEATLVRGEGTVVSGGGNVFASSDVPFAQAGDVVGADPAAVFADLLVVYVSSDDEIGLATLPVLADNGGPTQTIALLDDPANPAIGLADPATAPATDQRGFERDDDPDAGAFEAGASDGGVSPSPPPPPADGLTVTFLSEDADYDNSLGYYFKDESGEPTGEAGILFEEVSDEALEAGDTATLEGVAEDEVGFFLIRDGANLGLDFEGADFAFDGRGGLFVTEADGTETRLKDYQVQFDFEEGQLQVDVLGDDRFTLNFEDKGASEGSYDGDFDDAVFTLERFAADEAVV